MSEQLEPCPFCGSIPEITPWHGGSKSKRMVACVNDDCAVSPEVTGQTPAKAIAAWNKRAAPRAEGPPPRHAAMLQRLRMIIDDDVSSCTQRAHELTCIERRSEDPCGECELWDCASALLNDLTQATESSPAARGTQAVEEPTP